MSCLQFVKVCSTGFSKWIDVIGLHIARIERFLTDATDAFCGTP
jgi:hypothetical protein